MTLREPDFAGSWYPGTERECRQQLDAFEAQAVDAAGDGPLRGCLVPHAGWDFSGRLAYNALREVSRRGAGADTVALFGYHMGPASQPTVLVEGAYWTPLGPLEVDEELARLVAQRFSMRQETPQRHQRDNTTELQAPLLRHLLPGARLLVLGVPAAPLALEIAEEVVQLAAARGRALVAVGSTDLTHYGPNYGFSPRGRGPEAARWARQENDQRLLDLACGLRDEELIEEALAHHNACCPGAAAAALRCGKLQGASEGQLLAYASSLDLHRAESFVGYAAVVF